MQTVFADLNIHIGRDLAGRPVKITGSKNLTLQKIFQEAKSKGIHLIGIVDCQVPAILNELKALEQSGTVTELGDGGIRFENMTLILASEIEVYDANCQGPIHVLCYLPTIQAMEKFSEWLSGHMKNINLSSQRYYGTATLLQQKVKALGGLFIPAHIFTPFKSLYGKGVEKSLTEVFDATLIDGLELGLSSDTSMVSKIAEIQSYPFLTNSDTHSLPKIAREYQAIYMANPSFKELSWALKNINGRKILANYGMNPKLGKYHSTVCKHCSENTNGEICEHCGSQKIVKGVKERIAELSTEQSNHVHPPYIHQVPLEYLPKLGPKTYAKLLTRFNTEMEVIHFASFDELLEVIPHQLAKMILANREGKLAIKTGGGGKYGSIQLDS